MIYKNKKQQGFSILTFLLVIVITIATIGVWATSGNSGRSTNTINDELNFLTMNLIQDSSAIKATYDQIYINQGDYQKITFIPNDPSPNNILNPTTGIISPKVHPFLIEDNHLPTDGIWIYNPRNFTADNIGDAGPDPAIMVFGITDAACAKINMTLHNFPFILTVPNRFPSPASTVGGASVLFPTSNADISSISYLTNNGSINGSESTGLAWTAGCISTATSATNYVGYNQNMFFRVLKTH